MRMRKIMALCFAFVVAVLPMTETVVYAENAVITDLDGDAVVLDAPKTDGYEKKKFKITMGQVFQGRGSRFNVTFSKGTTHKNLQNIRIEKKTGKKDYSDETKPLTSGSFATKVTAVVEDAAHNQLAKTTASAKKGVVKVTLKKGFEIPAGNRIYVTTKVGDTTDEKLMDTVSFMVSTTPVDIKTIKATRYGNPLENNTITWEVRSDIVLNAYDKKGDLVPYNLVKFTSSDPSFVSIDAAGKVTVNAPSGTKKGYQNYGDNAGWKQQEEGCNNLETGLFKCVMT